MTLSNEIRKLMVDCDMTLTKLAKLISEQKNKHYTVQNLSQKFRNNTLNAYEIEIILDALDYKLLFYPKNKRK